MPKSIGVRGTEAGKTCFSGLCTLASISTAQESQGLSSLSFGVAYRFGLNEVRICSTIACVGRFGDQYGQEDVA